MGTNYYAWIDVCPHCDRPDEKIHIGKQSAGWPFLFRGYHSEPWDDPPFHIEDIEEWLKFVRNNDVIIYDEYGRKEDKTEFIELVTYPHKKHTDDGAEYKGGFRFEFREFS